MEQKYKIRTADFINVITIDHPLDDVIIINHQNPYSSKDLSIDKQTTILKYTFNTTFFSSQVSKKKSISLIESMASLHHLQNPLLKLFHDFFNTNTTLYMIHPTKSITIFPKTARNSPLFFWNLDTVIPAEA